MQEELKKLVDMYTLSPAQFEEYKKNVIMILTTGVQKAKENKDILMIVGGQPGAGKSRLSTAMNEEHYILFINQYVQVIQILYIEYYNTIQMM